MRTRKLLIGASFSIVLLLIALAAQLLCPHDPNAQIFSPLQSPSLEHPAGTDRFGRDMFSRILVALQTSLLSSLILVLIITSLGCLIGFICAYKGGIIDNLLMRISDICLAFPGLVFALAIAALLQGGLQNAILALALVSWPKYARIARSQSLAILSSDYIAAAKLAGGSSHHIVAQHILPNTLGPILVTATLDIGTMMMELAALSFLGLGASPPTAELGQMMSAGRSMLQSYPWLIIGPGIAMFIAVACFNVMGDALRDYLDPRALH